MPVFPQLSDDNLFTWHLRVRENADFKTLPELHVRIAHYVSGCLVQGDDQFTKGDIAKALKISVRTVGDALRRLRGVGLIGWVQQFTITAAGLRRQVANRYWLIMPAVETVARPDLRRSGVGNLCRARKQVRSYGGGDLWITERDSAARQLRALGAAVPASWGL